MGAIGFHNPELFVERIIKKHVAEHAIVLRNTPVGGGCINHALKVETTLGVFFLKFNKEKPENFFEIEQKGLELLRNRQKAIFIPNVLGVGQEGAIQYLLMEHTVATKRSLLFWENFGAALATMHLRTRDTTFGLDYDNFIGSLPQKNKPISTDWPSFYVENRIIHLVEQAYSQKLINDTIRADFYTLVEKIKNVLPPSEPSLIHGDLWSGNVITHQGEAALIDPAVYYADREIELAFTRLFGGFPDTFYHAYFDVYPVDADYEKIREDIYHIYPLLVHALLFGTQYVKSVLAIVRRLQKKL